MNTNIVIYSILRSMRRQFLLIAGRIFQMYAQVVWKTSLQTTMAFKYWCVLVALGRKLDHPY